MRVHRSLVACALAATAGASAAAWLLARQVEHRVAGRLRASGASVRQVRFSWLGPLCVEGMTLGPLTIDTVEVRWGWLGGADVRTHVRSVRLAGVRLARQGLSAFWPQPSFDVVEWRRGGGVERVRLQQRAGGGDVEAVWRAGEAVLSMSRLDLRPLLVQWKGEAVLDAGRWSGRVSLTRNGERLSTEGTLCGESIRVGLPRALGTDGYGAPTDAEVAWSAWHDGDAIDARRLSARVDGLDLTCHGRLIPSADYQADLELSLHSELGAAFRTVGLTPRPPLGASGTDRFGTASLDVSLRGPLLDPAALEITPHLRFTPEPEVVRAIAYLRGPFRYAPAASPGVVVDVREGAPDFVPIDAVPPLVQRAVLLAEDAGFFTHAGIDLTEIPVAWAANQERGALARGASTITQQLVKNLLLSEDKTYGRKASEAVLALSVDAAVPKERLLEIYLNVIEWGPGVYGLAPAARHYFGKSPSELTAKETAFLVRLIPSPIHYHQAHAVGSVGPGMEQLIRDLLAKLHSVGALGDEEYEEALGEELRFRPEEATGAISAKYGA